MDKRRLHRELLKKSLFNMDFSKIPVKKEIVVEMGENPYWPGYGTVTITSDGPDGFSQMSTHQKDPVQYAKDRIKNSKGCPVNDLSEHELIIR